MKARFSEMAYHIDLSVQLNIPVKVKCNTLGLTTKYSPFLLVNTGEKPVDSLFNSTLPEASNEWIALVLEGFCEVVNIT